MFIELLSSLVTPTVESFESTSLFVSTYCRVESAEKVSPVEKRYEPLPQISPSSQYGPPASAIPPNTLPKLIPNEGKLYYFSCLTLRLHHVH